MAGGGDTSDENDDSEDDNDDFDAMGTFEEPII